MMMNHIRAWMAFLPVVSIGLAGPLGCDRNPRLVGKDIRNVTVRAVTHYGITLDEDAAPKKTAFVLLRAMWEDFFAEDEAQRKAALDVQFDVAAANAIAGRNPTSLGRNEIVYQTVHRWTPTVSHYVHDFETEWEQANGRLIEVGPIQGRGAGSGGAEFQALMEVADADADPNARVMLVVQLVQDTGLWRVTQVGFIQGARGLPDRASVADIPVDEGAFPGE
ncbi:MAG: hypothetical protein ACYTFA_02970 [Planctomycetota bacterium]|jgi:hypothetical protein